MWFYDSLLFGIGLNSTSLAASLIFIAYTLGGNTLTASKVFPALFMLNTFRLFAGLFLGKSI